MKGKRSLKGRSSYSKVVKKPLIPPLSLSNFRNPCPLVSAGAAEKSSDEGGPSYTEKIARGKIH